MIRNHKFTSILLIVLSFLSCVENSEVNNQTSSCYSKSSLENFEMALSDCVVIIENPDMTLILVEIQNQIKSDNLPYNTIVTVRLEEENFSWETPHNIIDDPNTETIDFSGEIRTGINEDQYTIYIDDIEFTETATELIFHSISLRVQYTLDQ